MSQARHQASNQRFNAFFNRLTKARLSGAPLAPALAEAIGTELAQLNPATDLPPDAAKLWTGFLETYITFSGEAEIALRREEVMLRGSGKIVFGHAAAESAGDTVEFAIRR